MENGALVKRYNHDWLHSLPPEERKEVNKQLIEFKAGIMRVTENGLEVEAGIELTIEKPKEGECLIIPAFDITPEVMEERKRKKKQQTFNRAREKRQFQEEVDDYFEHLEDYER